MGSRDNGYNAQIFKLARPTKQRQLELQESVYKEWVKGCSHVEISRRCGVSPGTVTRYVGKFLKAQPIAQLSKEEREAAIWQEWAEIGNRLRNDMEVQRQQGRTKIVRTHHPDGTTTVEESTITGCDPQLYRAWGAHLDRKARQMLDQTPVAEGGTQINVSMVKEFLGQAQAPAARMSAAEWNSQAIDVDAV